MRRDLAWPWQKPEDEKQAGYDQRRTRQKKKPVRSVEQHESQMTPAIAEATQVRRTAALVRPVRDGNFRDARAELRRPDYKLGRKLHPSTAQIHAFVNAPSKTAHAAMAIAYASVKKKIQDR